MQIFFFSHIKASISSSLKKFPLSHFRPIYHQKARRLQKISIAFFQNLSVASNSLVLKIGTHSTGRCVLTMQNPLLSKNEITFSHLKLEIDHVPYVMDVRKYLHVVPDLQNL